LKKLNLDKLEESKQMKTTEKRIVVTLIASILLAVTLPFSTAARQATPGKGTKTPNTAGKSMARKSTKKSLTSIYTDFDKQCRPLQEPTDTDLTLLWRCSGAAGHKLLFEWDDDAFTATMITPRGKKFDLGLSELFAEHKAYASLGAKAEWRVKQQHGTVVPVAVILRIDPWTDGITHEPSFFGGRQDYEAADLHNRQDCAGGQGK